MKAPSRPSVEHELDSASTISQLFGVCFRRAYQELEGTDISGLLSTEPGNFGALGWGLDAERSALEQYLQILADRDPRHRQRFRREERQRFRDLLGPWLEQSRSRAMFVAAYAIDCGFVGRVDAKVLLHATVAAHPPSFFRDEDGGPPPIGQMTPIAACRRWMSAFWFLGDTRPLEAFGSPLTLERCELLPSTSQSLQAACDADALRVAVVSYRRHQTEDLCRLPAQTGCFAIGGLATSSPPDLLRGVLDQLNARKVHIAVMPELALCAAELDFVRTQMRTTLRRFPCLLVAGLTHQPHGSAHINEAVVLDARGDELMRHEKLEPYADPDGALEDIIPRASGSYRYLDTPVGRLVVNICRDVRSDQPMLLNRALGVTLLIVPAYSARLDFAREEAVILGARQSTITVGVNPAVAQLRDAAMLYAPIRGAEASVRATLQADLVADPAPVQVFTLTRARGKRAIISPDEAPLITAV